MFSLVPVTNGLYTVPLDFGSGVFNGSNYWLQISVRTNGGDAFTVLSPAQPITHTPYSIFANGASNLLGQLPAGQVSGTLGNGQLANSSITVNAGPGLAGGGPASLGSSVTVSNTGVLSVSGDAEGYVTASTVNGNVTLGLGNLSASETPGTITLRDTNGSIAANSATLSGVLNLPDPGIIYSGSNVFVIEEGSLYVGKNGGSAIINGADTLHNTGFGDFALNIEATTGLGASYNTAVGESARRHRPSARRYSCPTC